jgi:hypothetical protein
VAVFGTLARGICEAAGPFLGRARREPAFDETGEAIVPNREELGTVIEVALAEAPGRHPAADTAALVQHRYTPPFTLQLVGGEQA